MHSASTVEMKSEIRSPAVMFIPALLLHRRHRSIPAPLHGSYLLAFFLKIHEKNTNFIDLNRTLH